VYLSGLHRFLFNPFTVATCIARPTIVFTNCAILVALSNAVRGTQRHKGGLIEAADATIGRSVPAVLALALSSYLSLYPLLLFPPLVLLCYDSVPLSDTKRSLNVRKLNHYWSFKKIVELNSIHSELRNPPFDNICCVERSLTLPLLRDHFFLLGILGFHLWSTSPTPRPNT